MSDDAHASIPAACLYNFILGLGAIDPIDQGTHGKFSGEREWRAIGGLTFDSRKEGDFPDKSPEHSRTSIALGG